MKYLLIPAFLGLLFLLSAFVFATFDIRYWDIHGRAFIAILALAGTGAITAILTDTNTQNK